MTQTGRFAVWVTHPSRTQLPAADALVASRKNLSHFHNSVTIAVRRGSYLSRNPGHRLSGSGSLSSPERKLINSALSFRVKADLEILRRIDDMRFLGPWETSAITRFSRVVRDVFSPTGFQNVKCTTVKINLVFAHFARAVSLCLVTSLMVLSFCLPALAALGGDVSSIDADNACMKATVNLARNDNYEVHEMKSPGGTVLREFVSPGGRVFAVAWHGPFMPELQQILGTYFQQYSTALQSQKKRYGRAPLNLQLPGLVVQEGGHMRAYVGRAYLPEMLPPGVQAQEIK